VTHYYFVRLPISLILIIICILTPFAVNWSAAVDLTGASENTTAINNDLLFSATNLSFIQNHVNQVRFPRRKSVGSGSYPMEFNSGSIFLFF
jgi:hypothetical protein